MNCLNIRVCSFSFFIVVCFFFMGCGKGDGGVEFDDENLILGVWDLIKVKSDGYINGELEYSEEATVEDLLEEGDGVESLRFVFHPNGAGSLTAVGREDGQNLNENVEFRYVYSRDKINFTFQEENEIFDLTSVDVSTLNSTHLTMKSVETVQQQDVTFRSEIELSFQRAR